MTQDLERSNRSVNSEIPAPLTPPSPQHAPKSSSPQTPPPFGPFSSPPTPPPPPSPTPEIPASPVKETQPILKTLPPERKSSPVISTTPAAQPEIKPLPENPPKTPPPTPFPTPPTQETTKTPSLEPSPTKAPPATLPSPSRTELPRAPKTFTPPRSSSLNLPSFQRSPQESLTNQLPKTAAIGIERKTLPSRETPPSSPPTPSAEASLRTGTWPIEEASKKSSVLPPRATSVSETPGSKTLPDNIVFDQGWGWKKFLLAAVVALLIASGGYYFWTTRQPSNSPGNSFFSLPDISVDTSLTTLEQKKALEKLPFSAEKSNPFIIDVETETVSTIRERLLTHAKTMKEAGMNGPVPFAVVDKTNTPIAFFIFASVLNLSLSGDLLNSLENNFTLFLFLDKGSPRLGLSIKIKGKSDAKKFLAASEGTLPISLKNLLLVEKPPTEAFPVFASAKYREAPVRYFNFPAQNNLSLDYVLAKDFLVIATSKNTSEALVDLLIEKPAL